MILAATGTLEDEWAVNAAVGTDDEAYSNFYAWIGGSKDRIGSGESLGRMSPLTTGRGTSARHVGEFGDMDRSPPKLVFTRGEMIGAGNAQGCARG